MKYPRYSLILLFLLLPWRIEAQPLLSHLEEGDRIELQIQVFSCFNVFNHIYEFEMNDGKTECTAFRLPYKKRSEESQKIPTGPRVLSEQEIEGIDSEIISFRKSSRAKPLETRSEGGVSYLHRGDYSASTTSRVVTLSFYENGAQIIEEKIQNPVFNRYYGSKHLGLQKLQKAMQKSSEAGHAP